MEKNLRNRNFTSVKNHLLPADCRELTEAELFLVNGGREVENSNAGVANAQVGDTVTRNDNTTVTITQGDIDWAQAHCEGGDNSNNGGTGAGDMEAAPNSPSPSAPSSNPSAYGAQSQPGNGSGAPIGMPSYSAWGSGGSTQEMTASGVGNPLGQNSGSIGYQPQGSQGDGTGVGSSRNPGYSYNGGYDNLPDSLNPNSPSFSAADMGYYQSMNSMANLQSSNVQSETCAEVDVGAAGNKNAITRVFSKLFQNDGSKRVFTAGVSGSATYVAGSNAISAGVYINPRNDSLFVISAKLVSAKNPVIKMAGTLLMAGNIEDAGGYLGFSAGLGLGFSASFGGTVGVFKNIDSLKGSCIETGVSGGPPGFSLGADELVSLDQQLNGVTTSLGIGAGTPFEAHGRLGTTITYGISNTLGAKQ